MLFSQRFHVLHGEPLYTFVGLDGPVLLTVIRDEVVLQALPVRNKCADELLKGCVGIPLAFEVYEGINLRVLGRLVVILAQERRDVGKVQPPEGFVELIIILISEWSLEVDSHSFLETFVTISEFLVHTGFREEYYRHHASPLFRGNW